MRSEDVQLWFALHTSWERDFRVLMGVMAHSWWLRVDRLGGSRPTVPLKMPAFWADSWQLCHPASGRQRWATQSPCAGHIRVDIFGACRVRIGGNAPLLAILKTTGGVSVCAPNSG